MTNFEEYHELSGFEVFNIFKSKNNKTYIQLEKSNCLDIVYAIQKKS